MATKDSTLYIHAFETTAVPLSTKDSIIQKKIESIPSIFNTEKSIPNFDKSYPKTAQSEFQPFWILLISMLLIALMSNLMHREFNNFIMGFFSNRAKSVNAEKDDKMRFFTRIVSLFFIFNLSIFLLRIIEIGGWQLPVDWGINRFYIIMVILLVLWIAKTIITLAIHTIFTNFKNGIELLKINQQVELIMTILLIPLNFLYFYTFQSLDFGYIGLGILSILLLSGMIKLFFSLKQISNLQSYQIFIYLCTLEILPLLVIFKYFS